MKRILKISTVIILLLCMILPISACTTVTKTEEEYQFSTQIRYALKGDKKAINPLIYGQFIEHIETCIYDGIWAEIVLDRKFYYEVGNSGLSPWKATDSDKVVSNTEVTLSGDHSAQIEAGAGIYQKKLSFDIKDYTGYFWCKSATGCVVKVTLSDSKNSVSTTVTVPANSDFTKCDYTINCDFTTLSGTYSLDVVEGEGYFDSLSMMPADNYKGMRKDTLDLLKELNSPMYRWPGGNFLSGYDWTDGIGDIDKRPSRRNLHYMGLESSFESVDAQIASDMVTLNRLGFYGGIEPNDFGLDEFMAMCEYLETEPLMMVNTGLGTVEQAVAQVEYCNSSTSTTYGAMRAANGHAQPYNIKYWGVGNEMFGSWQLGHTSITEYVVRHNTFVDAMKQVDANIYIVASGENSSSWSDGIFSSCSGKFDAIAEHMYGLRDETDVYTHIKNIKTNMEGRIKNHRNLLAKYSASGDVKIAFTEYAYDKAECPSRLKDAMGISAMLNSIINNADVFELACYSSTVNATQGCITTDSLGSCMQGAGYVLKLYHDYMQNNNIESVVRTNDDLQLDISVAVSDDGKTLTIAVVNPSEFSVALTNDAFADAKNISRHTLLGDYYDSYNTTAKDELYTEHKDNLLNVVAPAMSVNVFVIQLQ